jgi:hypothetical protein
MILRIILILAICAMVQLQHPGAAFFFGVMYVLAAIKDVFSGIITIKQKPKP